MNEIFMKQFLNKNNIQLTECADGWYFYIGGKLFFCEGSKVTAIELAYKELTRHNQHQEELDDWSYNYE